MLLADHREFSETGLVPIHEVIETEPVPGQFGRKVRVGTASNSAIVYLVDKTDVPSEDEFWKIPDHVMQAATDARLRYIQCD